MNNKYIIIFILLNFGLYVSPVIAQQVTIETIVDTNAIELGRHAKLTYRITKGPKDKIIPPVIQDTLVEGVELVSSADLDSIPLKDGKNQIDQVITITSFEEGMYYLKPQPFILLSEYGVDTIYSKDSYLRVVGVKLDTTGVIRDINDIEHVKRTLRDFLPLIISILVLILVFVFIFIILPKIRKTRNEPEEIEEKEPAHVIALRELDKLKAQKLWQQDKLKEYYSGLTAIIRKYLENQFSVQAMEETTYEILRDVRLRGLDSKMNMRDLEGLLNLADLVKFAKGMADPEENMEHLENAYKLVKETQNLEKPAHTSVSVDADDEFMKFIFNGVDHCVDSIKNSNSPLVPIVMVKQGEEQKLQRFVSDDYQEAVKLAMNYLKKLQPKPQFALLAYDGFVTIEERKNEALYVKGYDKKEAKGLVFVQRYQPQTDNVEFQLIGNPALIGKEENILRQIN